MANVERRNRRKVKKKLQNGWLENRAIRGQIQAADSGKERA